MNEIDNFKKLIIWIEAKDIAIKVYELCSKLPQDEIYGLSSQMRRSAVSISSNIAEGYRRNSKPDFKRFLNISLGSAAELETQLIICGEVYDEVDVNVLVDSTVIIQRRIIAFIKTL